MSNYLPDKVLAQEDLEDYYFVVSHNYDSGSNRFKVYKSDPASGFPVLCHSEYAFQSMNEHIRDFLEQEVAQYEKIVEKNKKALKDLKDKRRKFLKQNGL